MELTIDRLAFRYDTGGGAFQLDVPRLEVPSSASLAVVGPSGAGKTTLLHLLAGLLVPDRGRITLSDPEVPAAVAEVCLADLGDAARRAFRLTHIGAVFQTFALLDYLSVEENIVLPFRLGRALALSEAVRERARSLARAVGLGDKLVRLPGALSQGERQRVAICRAVVTRPRLVIADEPTGNLDLETKHAVLEVLQAQVADLGATLVTVTHDRGLLDRFDAVYEVGLAAAPAGPAA